MHYSFSSFYFSLIYRIIFINSIVFGCLNQLSLSSFSQCFFVGSIRDYGYSYIFDWRPGLLYCERSYFNLICSFRRDTHGGVMEEEDMQWSSYIYRIIPHDQRDKTNVMQLDVMQSPLHSVLFFGKMEMQWRFLFWLKTHQ